MNQPAKGLALFDFDGTLTRGDTFFFFFLYTESVPSLMKAFFQLFFVIFFYLLGLVSNHKAKQIVVNYFWKGKKEEELYRKGEEFYPKLQGFLRKKALSRLNFHKKRGDRLLLVSASFPYWLAPFAREHNMEVVCSQMQCSDGRITGQMSSLNCYGPEKVRRILEILTPEDYKDICAYGDSKGDREMLTLAHHSFYKPFRKNWQVSDE